MSIQPIKLYGHSITPNPRKVLVILEELGIPYELIETDVKDGLFTKINPNGRVPAIIDPNNDNIILWESGTIVEYLVETYDKENKLNLTSASDKWHLKKFLAFQISGQGPYYGQATWFTAYHPEDVPSAKERYRDQTLRVIGVLDNLLEGKSYLIGDKCTYADLAFVPWDIIALSFLFPDRAEEIQKKHPNFWAWHQRLVERPAVKKVYAK